MARTKEFDDAFHGVEGIVDGRVIGAVVECGLNPIQGLVPVSEAVLVGQVDERVTELFFSPGYVWDAGEERSVPGMELKLWTGDKTRIIVYFLNFAGSPMQDQMGVFVYANQIVYKGREVRIHGERLYVAGKGQEGPEIGACMDGGVLGIGNIGRFAEWKNIRLDHDRTVREVLTDMNIVPYLRLAGFLDGVCVTSAAIRVEKIPTEERYNDLTTHLMEITVGTVIDEFQLRLPLTSDGEGQYIARYGDLTIDGKPTELRSVGSTEDVTPQVVLASDILVGGLVLTREKGGSYRLTQDLPKGGNQVVVGANQGTQAADVKELAMVREKADSDVPDWLSGSIRLPLAINTHGIANLEGLRLRYPQVIVKGADVVRVFLDRVGDKIGFVLILGGGAWPIELPYGRISFSGDTVLLKEVAQVYCWELIVATSPTSKIHDINIEVRDGEVVEVRQLVDRSQTQADVYFDRTSGQDNDEQVEDVKPEGKPIRIAVLDEVAREIGERLPVGSISLEGWGDTTCYHAEIGCLQVTGSMYFYINLGTSNGLVVLNLFDLVGGCVDTACVTVGREGMVTLSVDDSVVIVGQNLPGELVLVRRVDRLATGGFSYSLRQREQQVRPVVRGASFDERQLYAAVFGREQVVEEVPDEPVVSARQQVGTPRAEKARPEVSEPKQEVLRPVRARETYISPRQEAVNRLKRELADARKEAHGNKGKSADAIRQRITLILREIQDLEKVTDQDYEDGKRRSPKDRMNLNSWVGGGRGGGGGGGGSQELHHKPPGKISKVEMKERKKQERGGGSKAEKGKGRGQKKSGK